MGKIVPDEHIHEHATCFNLKDRGLIVISSCGHVGIVNSVRQAQEVSGVQKVHAIVGGFHLGPAPADYLNQVAAEVKKLQPDVVIPMHCSGNNFIQAVREQYDIKTARITPPHVTLAGTYWRSGPAHPAYEKETIAALNTLQGKIHKFELTLGGVQVFKTPRPVIYLDVAPDPGLLEARRADEYRGYAARVPRWIPAFLHQTMPGRKNTRAPPGQRAPYNRPRSRTRR